MINQPEQMLPMYLQIKNYFIQKIEAKELKEGDKLPSERELSEKFKISRMTARNALGELVKEGIAVRKGAKGTFISGTKVKRNVLSLGGLTTMLKESGFDAVDSDVLLFEVEEADQWLSQRLGVNLGTKCYHLIRRRKSQGKSLVIEDNFFNGTLVNGFEQFEFGNNSIREIIKANYDLIYSKSTQTIEMWYFSNRICEWFDIPKNTPGLKLTGLNYDQYGRPLEYSQTYYRGDLFCFSYEL